MFRMLKLQKDNFFEKKSFKFFLRSQNLLFLCIEYFYTIEYHKYTNSIMAKDKHVEQNIENTNAHDTTTNNNIILYVENASKAFDF